MCKTGGKCDVTQKTRRRCKRCRFDLCIASGMRADYVLDGSQVRRKRRNYGGGVVVVCVEAFTFVLGSHL